MDKQKVRLALRQLEEAAGEKLGEVYALACAQTIEAALSHAEGEAGWRSGYPESDGNLVDSCGDDVGYSLEDVERWRPIDAPTAPQEETTDEQILEAARAAGLIADLGGSPYSIKGQVAQLLNFARTMATPQVAVPEGYALVPVEPTHEMIEAGKKEADWYEHNAIDCYQAMLAAAPTAPQVAVPSLKPGLEWAIAKCRALQNQGFSHTRLDVMIRDLENCLSSAAAAPTAPAGEPRQEDVEIPGDDGLDIHAPEQPVSDPDGLTEPGRREAEQAYINCAFDYARDPIGSRDWILFWNGWRARNKAAPAPNEREIAARALDKVAKELALRAIPGGVDDALERSFCVNTLRSEAARLRAGKEDRT